MRPRNLALSGGVPSALPSSAAVAAAAVTAQIQVNLYLALRFLIASIPGNGRSSF